MSLLCSRTQDFVKWYEDLIIQSGFASYGLVKGTLLIHPRATFVWEKIQSFLNSEFKKIGIENVLFPSLIPLSEIEKEKQNLTGFVPELFLVQSSAKEANQEGSKVFLRPTSEILFSHYFRKNLESASDLPILLNQWSSVYRAEKNTKFFLRNCEFYWQEAHTLHKTPEEAQNYLHKFHSIYQDLISNTLQIATLIGEKTIGERFVGAEQTMTLEGIMQDGQVLQMATSHNLGTNFSKMFQITYNSNNQLVNPHQLSAGCSTRLIGALLMSHSDDKGLVLPWELNKHEVKVLVINNVITPEHELYNQINQQLSNLDFAWDFSNKSFGFKMKSEELVGTPIVLVLGKKEIENNQILFKSRIKDDKTFATIDQLKDLIHQEKQTYNQTLKQNSQNLLNTSIVEVLTLEEVKNVVVSKKVALVPWFDDESNEESFKSQKFNFTPRCIKERLTTTDKICFYSGKPANCLAYFGRAY